MEKQKYTGQGRGAATPLIDKAVIPYLPSNDLVDVVNLALLLGRPLLIVGEPGVGKTCLAKAVAEELDADYVRWNVKSTSTAAEGCYTFNWLQEIRELELAKLGRAIASVPNGSELAQDTETYRERYVQWGPLGQAFRAQKLTVLLIDEIDKAPIDFPNDLLSELEGFKVDVLETKINPLPEPAVRPLVIVTSNREKELPEAFLRRCLWHEIKPLDELAVLEIIKAHFPDETSNRLNEVHDELKMIWPEILRNRAASQSERRISTSEILDYFRAYFLEGLRDSPVRLSQRARIKATLLKNLEKP